MKRIASWLTFAVTVMPGATAFGASGAESDGISILMVLFIGFGAMIISFQAILVAILLFSMAKALFTKPLDKTEPALATERSDLRS